MPLPAAPPGPRQRVGAGGAQRLHSHRCTAPFQPCLTLHTLFTAALQLRRLGDFSVVDEAGIAEPVESLDYSKSKLFLSGGCRCSTLAPCALPGCAWQPAAVSCSAPVGSIPAALAHRSPCIV